MFFDPWFKRLYEKGLDEAARRALAEQRLPLFTGAWGAARAWLAAALVAKWRRPALLVAQDEASAVASSCKASPAWPTPPARKPCR
jgi:acyl-CoA synthetase (NDP forming)